jgi:hypothetical protein
MEIVSRCSGSEIQAKRLVKIHINCEANEQSYRYLQIPQY